MGLLIHEVEGFVCLQAAAGAFGITGLMGTQATTGSWAEMQNAAAAAASFYQRQAASLAGSPATVASSVTAFDTSSSSKARGVPYRTSVCCSAFLHTVFPFILPSLYLNLPFRTGQKLELALT
jgi:heterogeneous nuclear ribonucleoprotein F/H/epithelial splicing regulatory protein 1/2